MGTEKSAGSALALVLTLAACGQEPPPDANLVVNAFHGGGPAGKWERSNLEQYASAHDDLKPWIGLFDIYEDPIARELAGRVTSAAPPDVVVSPIAGAMRDLAAQGKLADLTDLWDEQGWNDTFPATLSAMSGLDGKKYFVPQAIQWNPVFYRTDVFEKLGLRPPATWDGFLKTCGTLYEAGYVPVTISTKWSPPVARWFTILDLRLNGPHFHEELMRGRVSWDNAGVRRVFEYWSALFDHHCFVESTRDNDYMEASDQLAQGKAAMWLIGDWLFETVPQEAVGNLDFFSFPVINPTIPRGEIAHVYGAFVPAGAAHSAEAQEYLAYLGSEPSQASNAEALDRLPSHVGVASVTLKARHLKGRDFLSRADDLTPLFEFSTDRQVARTALAQFVRFWKDRSTLDDVLARIESDRQKVYGEASPTPVLVFKDVTVIDMTGTPKARAPSTVVVSGTRITEVSDTKQVRVADGARVIDARGKYLIPGLWDMHVHVMSPGIPEITFPLLLANGVTGVRDMNGPMSLEDVRTLRRQIEAGDVLGPRFVSPGRLIDGAGRSPSALGPQVVSVATPEEAREAARTLGAQGADFIKVYNRVTPELHAAITEEASRLGLAVAGHVPHGVSASAASEAGQRSMEHFQGILEAASTRAEEALTFNLAAVRSMAGGEPPTPEMFTRFREYFKNVASTYDTTRAAELFARLVRNHTWQCPTLVSNRALFLSDVDDSFTEDPRLRYVPEEIRKTWLGPNPRKRLLDDAQAQRRRYRRILEATGDAHRAGVPFLTGTDLSVSFVYAGFSLHDELALLVEAGFEPEAALLAATRNPAQYLDALGEMGTVEEGKVADLVLLDGNPLEDIANTRRIAAVVVNGRLLDRVELDQILEE